jgi:hypothetical protein
MRMMFNIMLLYNPSSYHKQLLLFQFLAEPLFYIVQQLFFPGINLILSLKQSVAFHIPLLLHLFDLPLSFYLGFQR